MTHYATCVGCALVDSCQTRQKIKAGIAGLGIVSLKFRCAERRDMYPVGAAVWFRFPVVTGREWDGHGQMTACDFPGYVSGKSGNKIVGYITPGAVDKYGRYPFEPMNGGNGYVKAPLARVSHRDAPSVDLRYCGTCGAIPAFGEPCRADPEILEFAGQCEFSHAPDVLP